MADSDVTGLLRNLGSGDNTALDQLLPLVYAELRKMAGNHLRREPKGHTLQPTALVHEAYAKMVGQEQPNYRDRVHFLSIAAHVMREILIDHARSKATHKRGKGIEKFSLDEARDAGFERPAILIQLDDALRELERMDPQKSRLIEMRFFGGLTAEESSEVLQMPVNMVRKELRVAQAWLEREIHRDSASAGYRFRQFSRNKA